MFGRQPAVWIAGLVGIITGVWAIVANDVNVNSELVQSVVTFIVNLLGGFLIASKVMPVKTINEAGLTSGTIHKMAVDPSIEPVTEG